MLAPDVSVIVPVYNTMPYLRACLDSIVGQTLGPDRVQLVAVDDGSTDGSGALLDEYAEKHPDSFVVLHQENSGGPAAPCNAGLEVATGRYVFFLGADDYLGVEALERMVAAADEWSSDVLCARMVGVGGRFVSQALFAKTASDVPFPSRLLAMALSNTKLFRRSVLEQHGIRYALDLAVGSDQPFTIEAMLHARRISVLADYEYYYAVKRHDQQNITYTSGWRSRLEAMTAIIEHIADLLPAGEGRDAVLYRHFSVEIARLMRRDFAELHDQPSEQAELVSGVLALEDAYLTEDISSHLNVLTRVRYALARAGDLAGLRALEGAEDEVTPLRLEGTDLFLDYPGFRSGRPDNLYRVSGDAVKGSVIRAIGRADVCFEGSVVVVRASTGLLHGPVLLNAVRAVNGVAKAATRMPLGRAKPRLSAQATVADGTVTGRLDLADLLPTADETALWCLRFQIDTHEHTFSFPVRCEAHLEPSAGMPTTEITAKGHHSVVSLQLDDRGRVLLLMNGSKEAL